MISDTAKSTKYLRWVKEFNINPIPTRLSFRTEIDRNYNELEFRNMEALLVEMQVEILMPSETETSISDGSMV
jgi:hypothetical protein